MPVGGILSAIGGDSKCQWGGFLVPVGDSKCQWGDFKCQWEGF